LIKTEIINCINELEFLDFLYFVNFTFFLIKGLLYNCNCMNINTIFEKKGNCFFIAEAGVNHNGDKEIAKKLVDVAVEAKADAIKFQTFKADDLILENTPKAEYQEDTKYPNESFHSLLKRLELSHENFKELKKYCESKKILFLSTPFDINSAKFLNEIGIQAFKVSSGDFVNYQYLSYLIETKKPVLISSGMADEDEVETTMKFFEEKRFNKLVLFQCTTSYPAPFDSINLNVIKNFVKKYPNTPIGFSDHSPGDLMGAVAVALGASVVEKHFTLDKSMDGPDHKASLNPVELKRYIQNIRDVECALGENTKKIQDVEIKVKDVARKSLISRKSIEKGEKFSSENLIIKRPGTGLVPSMLDKIIGKKAMKSIPKNSLIKQDDIGD
jgi:N,N'-diacetyllegionaminate synthase